MNRAAKRTLHSARAAWPWLALFALGAVLVLLRQAHPAILAYPDAWTVPLAEWTNIAADWFVERARPFFAPLHAGLMRPFR